MDLRSFILKAWMMKYPFPLCANYCNEVPTARGVIHRVHHVVVINIHFLWLLKGQGGERWCSSPANKIKRSKISEKMKNWKVEKWKMKKWKFCRITGGQWGNKTCCIPMPIDMWALLIFCDTFKCFFFESILFFQLQTSEFHFTFRYWNSLKTVTKFWNYFLEVWEHANH